MFHDEHARVCFLFFSFRREKWENVEIKMEEENRGDDLKSEEYEDEDRRQTRFVRSSACIFETPFFRKDTQKRLPNYDPKNIEDVSKNSKNYHDGRYVDRSW